MKNSLTKEKLFNKVQTQISRPTQCNLNGNSLVNEIIRTKTQHHPNDFRKKTAKPYDRRRQKTNIKTYK